MIFESFEETTATYVKRLESDKWALVAQNFSLICVKNKFVCG